jgi:beta-glucosidase
MVRLSAALATAIPLVLAQNGTSTNSSSSPLDFATSPPHYPAPWGEGLGDWADAYEKARAFVSQLTLLEKVNREWN